MSKTSLMRSTITTARHGGRRAMGKRARLGQALSALGLILGTASAHAATLDVSASCSLADAIRAANTDAVSGGCPAGSGADVINLIPSSTTVLTSVVDTSPYDPSGGVAGLPYILSEVTINGNGSLITSDPSAPDLNLLGTFLGDLTLNDTTLSGASIAAIHAEYGTLTLNNVIISDNELGVDTRGNTFNLNRSSISDNGSGIFSVFDNLFMSQSSIVFNESHGAVLFVSGLHAENSTFSSNGGAGITGTPFGGITACTVTGNGDVGIGGSYYGFAIEASIVTGNHGPGLGREVSVNDVFGSELFSAQHSVLGHNSSSGVDGFVPDATNIIPAGPVGSILDPVLGAHGGLGLTHTLRIGGPADNAWPDCSAVPVDQKDQPRPGSNCDVGAVEMVTDPCGTLTPSLGCTVNGVPNRPCVGTSGADTIVAPASGAIVLGRGGNDILSASGSALICGGDGNDTITGSSASDQLFGGPGNDSISGGAGSDAILGGLGVDSCTGGIEDHAIQGCD